MGGHVDPRFARVREVFDRHFADGEELGAAFTVHLRGEPVVDLWGGVADRRSGRAWERDTPVLTYSCSKAVTATVLLLLAQRGLVDLAAPVADVWPEFAAAGKAGVRVEHLLTHQAGLPVLEDAVPVADFEDQAAIADRLARQTPLWEPGTAHGYHALTYGFLVGEVVRRATGRSVGELVATEIAGPLGLDLWLGAPDEVAARAARLSAGERPSPTTGTPEDPKAGTSEESEAGPSEESVAGTSEGPEAGTSEDLVAAMARDALDPHSLMNRALGNPPIHKLKGGANHPVILRAGWPALGVVTTARSLSAFYDALISGRLLTPGTLDDALRRRVNGPDRVLRIPSSFGLGYMRPALAFRTPARGECGAFGHTGLGGFLGLGDPEHGLAVGYTMNRMSNAVTGSLRALHLTEAVYAAL